MHYYILRTPNLPAVKNAPVLCCMLMCSILSSLSSARCLTLLSLACLPSALAKPVIAPEGCYILEPLEALEQLAFLWSAPEALEQLTFLWSPLEARLSNGLPIRISKNIPTLKAAY